MKVALVHDWLTGMRGGEKVLECLCELYPDAEIFTLVHARGRVSQRIEQLPIHTSFIQRLPAATRKWRLYLPLYPAAIEAFDLRGYELVISTSHAAAKGVIPDPAALHVSYVHTPMRYVWELGPEYSQRSGWLARTGLRLLGPWLRAWDVSCSPRVDRFVANSQHVARRIKRYYGRRASVLHPPVDTDFFTPEPGPREAYLLMVSALVPYKNLEQALEAVRGSGWTLLVAGEGPLRRQLEAQAGPEVRFLGWVDDQRLRQLYRRAAAYLLPGVEDFGISTLEAQACGCPAVALAQGGSLETVLDNRTGVLYTERSAQALRKAIDSCLRLSFNEEDLRRHALSFSRQRFLSEFQRLVDSPGSSP